MAVYYNDEGDLKLLAGSTMYADNPIGSILPYGGNTAPNGWFLCQGQVLNRIEYSDLFKAIGTSFGAGDDSTTFNIPDLRETVPIGIGENDTATIKSHDVYILGEFKDDQLQDHDHKVKKTGLEGGSAMEGIVNWSNGGSAANTSPASINTTTRTGTTTHGKQLGVNYIIKAKQVGVPADFLSKVEEIANAKIAALNLGAFYYSSIVTASNPSWGSVTYTFSTPVPPGKYLANIRCNNTTNTESVSVIANLPGGKLGETTLERTNWSGQGVMHMDGAPLNITTTTASIPGEVAILQAVSVNFQLHLTKIA